ncbi:MAG: hypothetical protein OXR84_15980 [Magnetovibrio sp.]|nr:hypothetical protein [Magnetovibrio sp.]
MEYTSLTDVVRDGLASAFYIGLSLFAVATFLILTANFNKALLVYRDLCNQLGARDKRLPPKVIFCAGVAFFVAGLVLYEPTFVGIGIVSLPLVVLSVRDLNRRDLFDDRDDGRQDG